MTEEPWRLSATRIAEAVRNRELFAREVIASHLGRIAAVNPIVNAVTVVFDTALAEAEALDGRIAAGHDPGPLAGVPFSVKENIDVAGYPTTHGVPHFAGAVAEADAPGVRRWRAAGAIPIGHSNMPDLTLAGNITVSQLFGETRNPWGAIRTPGGTSGGDGVTTATGMAALGLGNDSGGSVRLPAMFCGVTALRPGDGRVAQDHRIGGQDPTLASQLFPVDGPLARDVADLSLAFAALTGTDPADPRALPELAPTPAPPRRVAVCADPVGLGVDAQVREQIDAAATALAEAGYDVVEAEPPRIADALTSYGTLISAEFGRRWPSIRRLLTEASAQHMELSLRQRPTPGLDEYLDATATRFGVMRDWAAFARTYPLILAPVYTWRPFDADPFDTEAGLRVMFGMRMCTASTAVGVPAVAVPTGVVDGQPLGVQLIGPRFGEDLCLAAAAELQARFGTLTPVLEPVVSD